MGQELLGGGGEEDRNGESGHGMRRVEDGTGTVGAGSRNSMG